MRAVIQRVTEARVKVAGEMVGEINTGLLVLLAVQPQDTQATADKMVHKILHYRVFSDAAGKMNLSLLEVGGALLWVSQFTLAAETQKGLRPSFTSAAPPALACDLFEYAVAQSRKLCKRVETGRFGADMKVELVNDGPVTFLLDIG